MARLSTVGLGATPAEVVPLYRLEWSDDACDWVTEPKHPPDWPVTPRALGSETRISFAFSAPAERLDAVHVYLGTYARRNTAQLWCELLDNQDRVLKLTILDPGSFEDNGFVRIFGIADLRFTIGARYGVRLSAPAATETDRLAFYGFEVPLGRYEANRRLVRLRGDRSFTSLPVPRDFSEEARADYVVAALPGWLDDPERRHGLAAKLAESFAGVRFKTIELTDHRVFIPLLLQSRIVLFLPYGVDDLDGAITFDGLCFALHRAGVTTAVFDYLSRLSVDEMAAFVPSGRLAARDGEIRARRRSCHFAIEAAAPPTISCSFGHAVYLPAPSQGRIGIEHLEAMRDLVVRGRDPHVVVVSVLYRKSAVVTEFLRHIVRQTYRGAITTVLVDDRSPEPDADIARVYADIVSEGSGPSSRSRCVVVFGNEANLGNCASRMAGIAAVEGDLYIVVDCDCLLNRDFVASHVFEHWDPSVDVVIGPLNIETRGRDPVDLVRTLEREPALVPLEAEPQDPIQADGFVNCITRNFSIKRSSIGPEPLFDTDFSYSAAPGSGFGWEDVEMGYRLYRRGAVVRYTPSAFSVHCTHPSSIPDSKKVVGSMRNFRLLFEKHPDFALVGRRWATGVYSALSDWASAGKADGGEVQRGLDGLFSDSARRLAKLTQVYRRPRKAPLRVLTYRWHAPHQYELYKLPHDFTLATHLGLQMIDRWEYGQRPLRENARLVHSDAIDTRDYDVALLHFDENVVCSELSNGTLPASWGDPFRRFLAIDDLPKVAICHGTPAFEGQYGLDPGRKPSFVPHESRRRDLIEVLKAAKVKVVCNSWQAHEEWGFHDSRVIWHGFDPQEFPPGTYERDVLALQSDRNRPHYRGAWEHAGVLGRLDPGIRVETADHPGATLEMRGKNAFAEKQFRSYVDRIRQFTVYLNTTLRSPMPRSRGEAMMTGVVPVCLDNHDVAMFIRNGENGFYSSSPEELADFVNGLFRDPEGARRMGAEARRTALDVFNHDRYLAAWLDLLDDAAR